MTWEELEQLAREMRYRGLHYSWLELIEFSRNVVGSLVDAYQALLEGYGKVGQSNFSRCLVDPYYMQKVVRDK